MLITRTPFRISFAGGGTDLEAFYSQRPGMVLSTAIDKFMYLTVQERFGNTFRVGYSQTELAENRQTIQHPIVRACLEELGIEKGLEIVSIADIPSRTGLGSSSSFTVGLLHALHALQGHSVSARKLADQACQIEIHRLREPIGKQDQYIAAYGGFQFIQFQPDGEVFVDPVVWSRATKLELQRRLILFFTGTTRDAREILCRQTEGTCNHLAELEKLCGIARQMRDVLTSGKDLNDFGRLLHQAWEIKKGLEATISNSRIDDYYEHAIKAGALSGKLLGAGEGGFLLFFCEPHHQDRLREALSDLAQVPFSFESQGSKVIYVGEGRG